MEVGSEIAFLEMRRQAWNMDQASNRPFFGLHKHSWHLVRCGSCKKMILNADPKCPHCFQWRPDARVFSVLFPVVLTLTVATALLFCGRLGMKRWEQAERLRLESIELSSSSQDHRGGP